ncbi:sialidase family protein [Rhizohabitans arisaemae]|uniref:sialidase family protein n=1 Tax=Rhizohabitans arisaemae TaxID=2720610 RepID=UPI0024B26FD0|nr:sialidase family protein [Rhizohabitans arisaemae]
MRKNSRWVIAVALGVAVVFGPAGPASANGPSIGNPSVPDVLIEEPGAGGCQPWDPTLGTTHSTNRQLNETVPCAWFPSIAKLANGDLYVAYSYGTSHSNFSKIAARRSTDGGRTWSARQIIVDDPAIPDEKEPSLTALRDGRLLMTYYDYFPGRPNKHRRQVYLRSSSDNGVTWSAPTTLDSLVWDFPTSQMASNGELVELDNGTLVLPVYTMRALDGSIGWWGVHVLRSTDGGATWNRSDERVVMWDGPTGTISYSEPALADLGGGHIVMLARTSSNPAGTVRQSESFDYGATWSAPVDVPGLHGHAPHFLKLRDGSFFLTYGDVSGGFASSRPVVGRFYDPRRGWAATQGKMIYKTPRTNQSGWVYFPSSDMSYPGSVELDDGTILTVYYDRLEGILGGTFTRPVENRLDLWGMYQAGQATIQTDLTHTASSRPSLQPYGPIDGSIDYWHSAAADGPAPPVRQWTLTLDDTYPIGDVGVVLKPGYAESATVETAVTTDWRTVKTYTMRRTDDYDWTSAGGVPARHVRVSITDTSRNGDALLTEVALRTWPTTFDRAP